MFSRVLLSVLVCMSSFAWSADIVASDAFLPFDEARQLIFRGDVNVIMGGDSHLNVVEYDPQEVKVTLLPGDVVDVAPLRRHNYSVRPPTVVVRSNDRFKSLYRVSVLENSSLIAKDIESLSLSVEVNTSGSVMVEGVMNLNHLHVAKSGDVEIYWVDSHNLDVSADSGNVVLAGRVDFLTLKGSDRVNIDAAGLIANRSWVSATNDSHVSVFPVRELFAYSRENATIDVKQRPDVYAPVNQAPSAIVLNYVEMEKRAAAII